MNLSLRVLQVAAALTAVAMVNAAGDAQALTTKECSAKYKAAKSAGTLGNMKWNDFRKAHCGGSAGTQKAPSAKPAPVKIPVLPAVYPKAVSPKYAKEKPGRARMYTCRDQYRTNKAKNANGGMKWIMKGGGYYSRCNKVLKG